MARRHKKPEHKINRINLAKYVIKAQNGNKKALEYIVNETIDYIYYYCITLLCDEDEAVDAVQDIYVILLEKLKTLDNPDAFLGWLKVITSNYCKNRLSRKKPVVSMDEYEISNLREEADIQLNPEKSVEIEEIGEIIMSTIKQLPDTQKECVLMYYYHQLSIEQISGILNVNENTIKSRLFYARRAIKARLEVYDRDMFTLDGISPLAYITASLLHESDKLILPTATESILSAENLIHGESAVKLSGLAKTIPITVAKTSIAVKAITGTVIISAGILVSGGIINHTIKSADIQQKSVIETATEVTNPSTQPTTSLEIEPITSPNRDMETLFYANGFTDDDRRQKLTYNPSDDLNSENTKSYVYDLMNNAIDNYETLQSTYYYVDNSLCYYLTYCFSFENGTRSKEITYDADGTPLSYHIYDGISSHRFPFDNSANTRLIRSFNEEICERIIKDRNNKYANELKDNAQVFSGSRIDWQERRELDFTSLVDSRKRYKKINGEYLLVSRHDYASTSMAYTQYFPQSYAFNYLYNFDNWDITSVDTMGRILDRECFIIKGTSYGFNNVHSFDMYVDTETGAMLYFAGRDSNGEDISALITKEFIVNAPIDESIFEDNL